MTDGNKSLPIIDPAYRLMLEINQAVVKLPRHQRPGMGRRLEGAVFPNLLLAWNGLKGRLSESARLSFGWQMEDRLVLRALKQALLPRLEPSLSYDTYAGLPGRGVHRAVARVMAFQRRVRDEALAELLARFLAAWGAWSDTPGVGIPLGSAVSSLLSNLYLDPFDHWVKDDLGFKCYARYADDMAFLHADRAVLDALLPAARAFLAERLALALNERKTLLKRTGDGVDFLGYRLFYHHRLLRRKNMRKARTRLARMARQYARGALHQEDVKKSLAGWLGYACFADSYNFRRRLFAGFRLKRDQEQR